jgi:hypothetical protein
VIRPKPEVHAVSHWVPRRTRRVGRDGSKMRLALDQKGRAAETFSIHFNESTVLGNGATSVSALRGFGLANRGEKCAHMYGKASLFLVSHFSHSTTTICNSGPLISKIPLSITLLLVTLGSVASLRTQPSSRLARANRALLIQLGLCRVGTRVPDTLDHESESGS